jgi:hypothetical protein
VIATQHFFFPRLLPPCLRQTITDVSVWRRHVGKRRGKILRRDHSLPFAGLCRLIYIDWYFNIPFFRPVRLRAKLSAPINEPSPESLVSARLKGSTYSRNEVISVSPDHARREKTTFSRQRLVYCHGRVSLCGNIHSRLISSEQVPDAS